MAEFTKKAAEAKEVAEEVPDNEPVVHMEEEDDTGKVSEEDEDIHEDDLVKDTIENAGKEGEEEDLVVDSESSSDEDDNDDSNDFPNNVDEMSDGDTGSDPKPSSSTYEIKDGDEESILPPILDVEEDTNDDASSIEEVDPDGAPIMN